MSFLTLDKVVKRYGAATVINGVSLAAERGEFVVFVGPSGCGKSTLLRMIAGLEEVTEGDVSIDGRVVTGVEPADREVSSFGRLDPALGQPHDRRLAQIDERHLRVVERLEVAGHERRPLPAEPVVGRDQLARRSRDRSTMPRIFSAMNSHHSRVRRLVEQQVGVVARELHEARAAPHLLEERPPLRLGVVERARGRSPGGRTR